MIRSHADIVGGDAVIICHVPEYDFDAGLFQPGIVGAITDDRQVTLLDGTRVHAGSCWRNLEEIADALHAAEAMRAVDDHLLRNAR